MDSSNNNNNNKRARDAEDEADEAKRLRAEDLLDMLDDDTDAGGAAGDLASVMRSFEEEIVAGDVAGDVAPTTQPELGFLLEASDDELGLPPATASSSEEEAGAGEPEDAIGFGGQIWGFEDEIGGGGYAGFALTSPEAVAAAAAAAEWDDDGFDAGLFGFGDEVSALRHETMPAV
ncbi:unknown protein [Oryza sativa Japonica Group]|jgi:hypothetical protein|uniref:Os01g0131300 protein n=3 Tax=Oryza TaxID=4527 RepID=A0A0P0UXQ4_ORYSJ|nr:uncharacterized protein LOC4325980 [Oryza sativa Japonica Group]KAF2948233.1 hypothetical protein DAI22_01g021300 [Oryza sativa Japonica Group]BAA99375.1 unknown protein [Oryza sativa Japonica Group]BAF03839.1 Os01g0131300 [Oryza sativa Japonica Group]BAG95331.1 unnamed protein product [Oryza sativa Japonica Group]BAS70218.1 Os01g0131300 [Oryza sativa Japonica Group]|eukprot:NP_001041925.1 Os01g0131300 [Oryza sativa Japonica Group]